MGVEEGTHVCVRSKDGINQGVWGSNVVGKYVEEQITGHLWIGNEGLTG